VEVLEEIRLLTNLETSQEKLLQILLVGQPELDEKLDSVDLRQLKQRIALRSHLAPLDINETKGYIHRRLQLAGCANPGMLFPDDTILEIHRCSHGIARLINTLCENALIQGYARQTRAITPEMIEEIAADFRMNVMHPPSGGVVSGRAGGDDHGTEVQRAAKTLLDLYTYMRRIQSNETDLNADLNDAMGTGVRKHEPYI
jgi:general secretion pathway protein A